MSLLWGNENNTLLILNDVHSFGELKVTEGVSQGECLSTVVFCILLRFVMDVFYAELATNGWKSP